MKRGRPSSKSWGDAPLWQRLLLLPLLPPVFLATFGTLLVLFTFVCVWNCTVYGICWLRHKLTGSPLPSKHFVATGEGITGTGQMYPTGTLGNIRNDARGAFVDWQIRIEEEAGGFLILFSRDFGDRNAEGYDQWAADEVGLAQRLRHLEIDWNQPPSIT